MSKHTTWPAADAALFFAAPDLLDALKACEERLAGPDCAHCVGCGCELVFGDEHYDGCVVPPARAAIAKAEGR